MNAMKMTEIRRKAKEMGVEIRRMKKSDLIRAIQTAEGHTACFATGRTECDQLVCSWRADCLPAKKEEHNEHGLA